jgi:hypothetical protein
LKRCTYLHESKGEGVGGGVVVGDPEDGRIVAGEVRALGGGGGGRDGGGRRCGGWRGGVVVVRDAIGRRVGNCSHIW